MPRAPLSHTSGAYERSSSSEGSVGQSQQNKKRKNECIARKHYTEVEPKVFLCNLCDKLGRVVTIEQNKYSCSTVLWRHLKNVHRKEYIELKAKEESSSSQPSVANIFDRKVDTKQYFTGRTSEDTKEELVRFICQSASPWNIVCKKYFIRLLRYIAQEEISIPSIKAVKEKAFKLYMELKSGIRDRLESVDRVAITLDCWTSENRISFIGLTVHWIDKEWKMCECVLAIRQLEGSHTGECLSAAVLEVLAEFKVSAKVCAITTDNASNNATMMVILERALRPVNPHFSAKRHVLCIAHVINLVMQAGLKALRVVEDAPEPTFVDDVDITNLDGVVDGEESDTRAISLGDVVRRLREVVTAIRGSTKQEAKYFSYCIQLKTPNMRRIPLDCPTRWSSTYKMLRGCVDKRLVIDMMISSALRKTTLLDAEWDLIEKFVDLLKPLQEGTSIAIQSKTPTSNEGIVIIKGMMRRLEQIRVGISNSSVLPVGHTVSARQRNALASVCGAMRTKLEKYASVLTRNEAFTIGSLLDPSIKLRLIDPQAKNIILSTVRCIMESYSVSRNLGDRSTRFSAPSMRHNFLQTELEELLDPSELPQRVDPIEELDVYATAPPSFGAEVLHWWKTTGQISYPSLALVAKEFLAVQATSAACERLFSEGRRVINYRRSRLTAESVEVLMTLKSWYSNEDLRAEDGDDDDDDPFSINVDGPTV